MAAPVRRKAIKPYKSTAPPPEQSQWLKLHDAILAIYREEQRSMSYAELYNTAYHMARVHGEEMFKGLKQAFADHMSGEAAKLKVLRDDEYLAALRRVWERHKVALPLVRDVLLFMERDFLTKNRLPTVYELGMTSFREHIICADGITNPTRASAVLLANVERERNGIEVERSLLKSTTAMLVELLRDSSTMYAQDFEMAFLTTTSEFYGREAKQMLAAHDATVYLRKVETRLREEVDRAVQYLDASTMSKLISVVENEFIPEQAKTLVEMEGTGVVGLIKAQRNEDLARFYQILGRVGTCLASMRTAVSTYAQDLGDAANNDAETAADPQKWVQCLVDIKDQFDGLLERVLSKDKSFQTAINDSLRRSVAKQQRAPEYLSLFIDDKLRRGSKELNETELDAVLDKVLGLFRFLEDRDIFERYYKQHLAKRLLMQRSVSDDAERAMISKLKTECGHAFTTRMEGMFTDMKLSEDIMVGYRQQRADRGEAAGGIDLTVTVLTHTHWPIPLTPVPCRLPEELTTTFDTFKAYYLKRFSGRRLQYNPTMGSADLRANFPKRRHEIQVPTPVMAILLLFNDRDVYTYAELQETLELPEPELRRHLQSLVLGKYRLLTKENKTRDIEPTERIRYNEQFSANLVRLKIQQIAVKAEADPERKETQDRVEEDRKYEVDATIVRIMKSRKTMEHNNLVAEVTKQTAARFVPNPNMIKKRIETLIEQEYLERAPDDIRKYIYVA